METHRRSLYYTNRGELQYEDLELNSSHLELLYLGGAESKNLRDSTSSCSEQNTSPENKTFNFHLDDNTLNGSEIALNGDQITFSNNEFGEENNKGFFSIVVSEQETHRSTSRSGYNLNTLTQIEDTFHHIPKKLSPKMTHRTRSLSECKSAGFNNNNINNNPNICFEARLCSIKYTQVIFIELKPQII